MTRVVFSGSLLVGLCVGGVSWAQEGQFVFAFKAAPELPAPDLNLNCVEDGRPRWPAGSDAIAGAPGTVARAAYYCTLEQLDPCVQPAPVDPLTCDSGTPGTWGWQMSFTASGCDALIVGVTVTQTDIAPGSIEDCERGPGGKGGFDATWLASGPPPVGRIAGAISAIVLHLKKGTTLDPGSINFRPSVGAEENPATTCRFLVEYTTPDTTGQWCDLTLQYVDDLDGRGSGQPIDNKVTQAGQSVFQSVIPQTIEKTVRVTAGAVQFIRADTNVDGETDISDAIRTFMFLFQGASDPPCLSAADSNDDGFIDISDGIHTLNDLFIPGTAIPEPGPFACGIDPTADGLTCLAYDLCP